MAIYKGVHATITVSGTTIALANEGMIRVGQSATWESSLGKRTTDEVDGVKQIEWNCTRKISGDVLFRDLQTNRNTFNVELQISGVSNTKVVASGCTVDTYEMNSGGADDVVTEAIAGRAVDYYFA